MMAGRRLSETNELVEFVLQHLPMKEIFLARAVSHHWKELIETSVPLKQATFRAAPLAGRSRGCNCVQRSMSWLYSELLLW